jgi:hypothetical protein
MADPHSLLPGACYCRAVTYRVADAFEYAFICHCSDCQRTTGSAFKPFAGIEAHHLILASGESQLARLGDEANYNAFYSECGSLLYSVVRGGRYIHVTLGTLLELPTITPSAHIFVRSKAPWHVIGDALPQYQEFPPKWIDPDGRRLDR